MSAAAFPPAGGELLDAHEPLLEPETEYELPPEALLAPDAGGDRAFVANLDPSVLEFGTARASTSACQWCNAPLPDATAATCPSCGASLRPAQADLEVPGLTTSTAARQVPRGGEVLPPGTEPPVAPPPSPSPTGQGALLEGALPPVDLQLDEATVQEAVKPPDLEVRRLMLEMELEQLRAEQESEPAAREEPAT